LRVLVGSVGYRNLRDHSFGILVIEALAARPWPPSVSVEDISYNPVAVAQRIQDEAADRPFDLAIIVSAVERAGLEPGALSVYRWDNVLPKAHDIQASVAEAVTGVIALDNTLVVTRQFDGLPPTVVVVEVQPEIHAFGTELSPRVEQVFDRACDLVSRLAMRPADVALLPVAALGGGLEAPCRAAGVQVQSVTRPR
jgi:hydrogenase maturation protease